LLLGVFHYSLTKILQQIILVDYRALLNGGLLHDFLLLDYFTLYSLDSLDSLGILNG